MRVTAQDEIIRGSSDVLEILDKTLLVARALCKGMGK